jgi:hypothetical protein
LSVFGSFLGAGVEFRALLSASLALVGSSANAASELVADVNMSEKLGVPGALGGAGGGKPLLSDGAAVAIGAVFIKAPACKLFVVTRDGAKWISDEVSANPVPAPCERAIP